MVPRCIIYLPINGKRREFSYSVFRPSFDSVSAWICISSPYLLMPPHYLWNYYVVVGICLYTVGFIMLDPMSIRY